MIKMTEFSAQYALFGIVENNGRATTLLSQKISVRRFKILQKKQISVFQGPQHIYICN